jgi:hypothetical protein
MRRCGALLASFVGWTAAAGLLPLSKSPPDPVGAATKEGAGLKPGTTKTIGDPPMADGERQR